MLNSALRDNFYMDNKDFHGKFTEDGETFNYGLYGTIPVQHSFLDTLISATRKMHELLKKVEKKALTLAPSELIAKGFDSRIIPYLNLDYLSNSTVTSRFDVINDNGVPKFIELNNDTPFLLMENYKMDELMALSCGKKPTLENRLYMLQESLIVAIEESAEYLSKGVLECSVALVGYDKAVDLEEYTNMQFIGNLIHEAGLSVNYVDYSELKVDYNNKEVYTERTGVIDILFKLAYPYEFLIEDSYEDGSGSIGVDILKLVKEKHIALINPPSSHVLQHKSMFAYMWELVEQGRFFDRDEVEFITKHVPYTSLSSRYFENNNIDFVTKPSIGREGQSVVINRSTDIVSSKLNNYGDQLSIYQEYIEQPKQMVTVNDEPKLLSEVIGVFVIGGMFSGCVCRLGNEITEGDSHWIAMSL